MKIYVCAILLLISGMVNADPATQVRGGCLFGDKVFSVGAHTAPPCMRMICDMIGQISFEGCPRFTCNSLQRLIGYTDEDPSREYPYCCPQPICERRYPDQPYFLAYTEKEVQ
ncbi:uncharacterized protein LOC105199454 [Solenopsis invicta]|uniref:uncharacterized protein LOC105199454 n=1 Tax=Solenopsis invicta TaxID=13686 RepID=UPI000595F013|nr:uncharacterized protein LOC105199454 [Solenopsis invicta]